MQASPPQAKRTTTYGAKTESGSAGTRPCRAHGKRCAHKHRQRRCRKGSALSPLGRISHNAYKIHYRATLVRLRVSEKTSSRQLGALKCNPSSGLGATSSPKSAIWHLDLSRCLARLQADQLGGLRKRGEVLCNRFRRYCRRSAWSIVRRASSSSADAEKSYSF